MQIEAAHAALQALQAAFPQYPDANGLPESSVELYLRVLIDHVRDDSIGMEAVQQWVLNGPPEFPKPSQLLEACQEISRRRAREHPRQLPAEDGTLGRALTKEENAAALAAVRKAISAGAIAKHV